MANLFNLTLGIARALDIVAEGYATGGSASTLVDTNERKEADDYWKNGGAWILYDAGGAGASPEGEFAQIASFTNSTSTITFKGSPLPGLSAAPASGDKYAISKSRYPMDRLILYANTALADLGDIPYLDETLSTVTGQSEYTLPSELYRREIREVWVQTSKVANDNRWKLVRNWGIIPAAIGSAGKLYLPELSNGYAIRILYMRPHPTLRLASDKISPYVNEQLVIYMAGLKCLMWYKAKTDEASVPFNEQVNFMQSQVIRLQNSDRMFVPPKHSGLMIVE